jgi:aarF domain-containing kinase
MRNALKVQVDAMKLNNTDVSRYLENLGQQYDPKLLEAMFSKRGGDLNSRAVTVAGKLGLFITAIASDYMLGNLEKKQEKRGRELAELLSQLGPSFVKLGQALSLRPDLLPKPYLEALSELQDGLAPFDSYTAFEVIEQSLGRPLEDMFSHITPEPVAAASLGQVYKATLASTGETVAVKVQRPGIGESIAIDMLLLRRLLHVVDTSQDFLTQPLVPLVDEFSARLFGELDYIQEGHHCERFSELYKNVPRVTTPSI